MFGMLSNLSLTILFVILKLTDVIDWSWWWVFSPVIITWGMLLIVYVALLISSLVAFTADGKKEKISNLLKKDVVR